MTDDTNNLPPTISRVMVDGNPADPGSVIINASPGFIDILVGAGYRVTPL